MKRQFDLFCFLVPLFCMLTVGIGASESSLENIQQITYSSMGFTRAGEGYFSPDGQTIIFQAVPQGKQTYQIFSLNLNENIPRMVSTGRGACTCAFFRPDGKKIIFASSHEDPEPVDLTPNSSGKYKWDFTPYMNIYEADPDGSNLKALTTGPAYHAECAYSPDGKNIVYASNETETMQLYIMNADGSEKRQITFTENCYHGGPFFSPNGRQIVFRADPQRADYLQVYIIDTEGNNEQQVTDNEAVNWAPYWYPNGTVIAYTTSLHGHHQYEIYLLNLETKENYRVTYSKTFDGLPVFSPDGTKLLWTSKRSPDNSCQLFLADFTLPKHFEGQ